MLAEAIKTLEELAKRANSLTLLPIPGDPRNLLVRNGPDLETRTLPAPDRQHGYIGMADLIRAAKDTGISKAPELYVGDDKVVLVHDRDDRRARSSLPLVVSERFRVLQGLWPAKAFDPVEVAKLLRYRLSGTGLEPLVILLRRVDFSANKKSHAEAQHGRESMGRAVEMAVQGADKIPEDFQVDLRVYTTPGATFKAVVRMGLFLDVRAEKIEIGPLPDELGNALIAAQAFVVAELEKALPTVPIFQGTF